MCFEIHTHTLTRKVSVCVLIIDPVAGLDSTYLLSVIGLHYNRIYWHYWTLVTPLSFSFFLFLSLYSILILSANRSTPFAPVRFIYQLQKSLRFGSCEILQSRRREVINLFNASLIELTLAGRPSSGSRVIVRFLNSPFSNPFPCVAVKLAFYRFHCAQFPLLTPWADWPLALPSKIEIRLHRIPKSRRHEQMKSPSSNCRKSCLCGSTWRSSLPELISSSSDHHHQHLLTKTVTETLPGGCCNRPEGPCHAICGPWSRSPK